MKVAEILKNKPSAMVSSIGPDQTVAEAIRHMCEHRIGALLVRDQQGGPLGIITERDILLAADRDLDGFGKAKVSDLMSADLVCALPDDNVGYVMQVMTQSRLRHLPIVENKRVIGLISIGDVIKSQLEETQVENHMLKDYLHLKGEI